MFWLESIELQNKNYTGANMSVVSDDNKSKTNQYNMLQIFEMKSNNSY